jgi:hypothetical protein
MCEFRGQLIGFLGKDPEKRQVRGNGANFTVLCVATQQSSKDSNDEWQSKIVSSHRDARLPTAPREDFTHTFCESWVRIGFGIE